MLSTKPANIYFREKRVTSSRCITTFCFIFFCIAPAQAQIDSNTACYYKNNNATTHTPPREFSLDKRENIEIGADFTRTGSDGTINLDGNVIIEKHKLRITADHADYNKKDEVLNISGNVHIDTESISIQADDGRVDMNQSDDTGKFNNVSFFIPENQMKGRASHLRADDTSDETSQETRRSILSEASITSCDLLDPDWLISSDEIRLDHIDEYGSADDVVIRFKGVPFLYTPYIEFPTSDRRRSGFLFPEIGTSSSRGFELATPWYWNIAPNHDALLTPRYMEKRGAELGAHYRYLTRSSRGELKGTYLPQDSITREDRYQLRYLQNTVITPQLLLNIDAQDISDAEYFNDFSNSLGTTSQTHLYRNASLQYHIGDWQLRALLQDIKTIDETTPLADRPYKRLPQVTLNGDSPLSGTPLTFTLDSELVDFTHEDDTKTTGQRITVRPGLSLPLSGSAWFFTPAVKLSHTSYNVGTESGTSTEVEDRNLAMSSIDTGLFFEREISDGYRQTLEPRLYYLNVPFEDQSNIPLFDTSIPEFTVAQLFRDNRFIGGDRIGDANQATLALSSRVLDTRTGNELVRASIGQIFYFEDRRVSLDNTIDTANQSDVIAEFDTSWQQWKSNIDLQWDTSENRLSQENYFLHYRSDARHLFNIGYRKRLKDNNIDIEQTDTSLVYAIDDEYTGFVRWNYSLKDNKDIDTIAGIAYDSCCWSIQLLGQRRLQNSTSTSAYDNSILIQFVLKGLGNLSGSKARSTLEQSIYGYTDIYQ